MTPTDYHDTSLVLAIALGLSLGWNVILSWRPDDAKRRDGLIP